MEIGQQKTGEVTINAKDLNGKPENLSGTGTIAGYTYRVYYDETNTLFKESDQEKPIDIGRVIPIETDGKWKIEITAYDKAGNASAPFVTNIYKDTQKPSISTPSITEETETSFRITVSGRDETSKVAKFEYYIDGTKYDENKEGTIVVNRNITPNKTYTVTVKVIDNAGWSEESGSISAITKGELKPPSIIPATFNQYYNGNVTVSIQDTAEASKTRATRIIYKKTENGAEEIIEGRNGSFTISTDGTYKISACTQDAGGNRSGWTNANTFIRDASAPRPTLGTPTSTINSITVTANANETGGSRSKKLSIPIQNKCKWSMAKPW